MTTDVLALAAEIAPLFTHEAGYHCARWNRPIAPVFFGLEDESLPAFKGALEATCLLAGHQMAETDPELGSNLMVFFVREWRELGDVPNLDHLFENLAGLVKNLQERNAQKFQRFHYDAEGGIKLCIVALRIADETARLPAQTLALDFSARVMLTWSADGVGKRSLLAQAKGAAVLAPDIADIIAAAYDPSLPTCSSDPSHPMRVSARIGRMKAMLP